jgi:hypothetical protein
MTTAQKVNKLRKQASNYRGVSLDLTKVENKSKGIFRSRIAVNGVRYSLGYHATAEDAALAVNKKAKSLFKSEKAAQKAGYWNVI